MQKIFLTLFISLIFISGCTNKGEFTLTLTDAKEQYYKYYDLTDEMEIYTNFTEIEIILGEETLTLSEALEKNKITMLDIMHKVGYTTSLNDGGSLVYHYQNDDDFANLDFMIIDCYGTERIVIGNTSDVADYCRGNYE